MAPPERAAGSTPSPSAIVGGTVSGQHLLHIDCYSQATEDLPTGEWIKSRPFSAGGRSWSIKYFPNGNESSVADFISIFVHLEHSIVQPVKARVRLCLLDQAGEPVASHNRIRKKHGFCTAFPDFGYTEFIKRAWLEESKHLKDDCFTIRCEVTVTKELRAEERRPVVVPPSNLHRSLGDLLASEEGADVTFQVCGETFNAHGCVLAARSPVFKAEVLGTMKESTKGAVIRVDDMDAEVFRALLNFVYTDALPDFEDMKKREEAAMVQHLLVAADRFLSIPSTLNAVMATDGYDHLTRSCPSILKELMANIAARVSVDFEK